MGCGGWLFGLVYGVDRVASFEVDVLCLLLLCGCLSWSLCVLFDAMRDCKVAETTRTYIPSSFPSATPFPCNVYYSDSQQQAQSLHSFPFLLTKTPTVKYIVSSLGSIWFQD